MVYVAKIDHVGDFARLRPGIAHENVVIVGVAVDDAAAQPRQRRNHIRIVQPEEFFDEGAALRISDVLNIVLYPNGSRGIPLQLPVRGRMREGMQRGIHLAKKAAQITEQFQRVRADLGENRSLHKSK